MYMTSIHEELNTDQLNTWTTSALHVLFAGRRALFPLGLFQATHTGNTRIEPAVSSHFCSSVVCMCQLGFSSQINAVFPLNCNVVGLCFTSFQLCPDERINRYKVNETKP